MIIYIIQKTDRMNRYILAASLLLMASAADAQNEWEIPNAGKEDRETVTEVNRGEKTFPVSKDAKYLSGAVAECDGKVAWTLDIDLPGKSVQQVYDAMVNVLTDYTKGQNELEESRLALVNKNEHIAVAAVKEWLVFSESYLWLDRAKLSYTIVARCADGRASVSMERISLYYKEDNSAPEKRFPAEELVSDKVALNKKKTKLVPGNAKFRRRLVDRKDSLFEFITDGMKKKLDII